MADNKLMAISVSLYMTNKYLDSIIQGNKTELDVHLVLAMCASYRQNFEDILGKSENEHQNLSNQVFKFILNQVEKDKKLPMMGGLENQLVVMMAKAFKVELAKVNAKGEYNLNF